MNSKIVLFKELKLQNGVMKINTNLIHFVRKMYFVET